MRNLEQEIPVKVHGNGEVRPATLIRDLQNPFNDIVVYPAQDQQDPLQRTEPVIQPTSK